MAFKLIDKKAGDKNSGKIKWSIPHPSGLTRLQRRKAIRGGIDSPTQKRLAYEQRMERYYKRLIKLGHPNPETLIAKQTGL